MQNSVRSVRHEGISVRHEGLSVRFWPLSVRLLASSVRLSVRLLADLFDSYDSLALLPFTITENNIDADGAKIRD